MRKSSSSSTGGQPCALLTSCPAAGEASTSVSRRNAKRTIAGYHGRLPRKGGRMKSLHVKFLLAIALSLAAAAASGQSLPISSPDYQALSQAPAAPTGNLV